MSHVHRNGRVCHLNGCNNETVPVECPACEQVIGRAPMGGMVQSSATWDKRERHLTDCPSLMRIVALCGPPCSGKTPRLAHHLTLAWWALPQAMGWDRDPGELDPRWANPALGC